MKRKILSMIIGSHRFQVDDDDSGEEDWLYELFDSFSAQGLEEEDAIDRTENGLIH